MLSSLSRTNRDRADVYRVFPTTDIDVDRLDRALLGRLLENQTFERGFDKPRRVSLLDQDEDRRYDQFPFDLVSESNLGVIGNIAMFKLHRNYIDWKSNTLVTEM